MSTAALAALYMQEEPLELHAVGAPNLPYLVDGKVNARVEFYIGGQWLDITSYGGASRVHSSAGIHIKRGENAEQSDMPTGTMEFTLLSNDSLFANENPYSEFYGLLTRNLPVRVLLGNEIRFTGEIAAFPQRSDTTGRSITVPISAAGIKRRLAQGTPRNISPVRSLALMHEAYHIWPLTDGESSSFAAPAQQSGVPLTFATVNTPVFAKIQGPYGAPQKFPDFTNNNLGWNPTLLTTRLLDLQGAASWVLDFMCNVDMSNATENSIVIAIQLWADNAKYQWMHYIRHNYAAFTPPSDEFGYGSSVSEAAAPGYIIDIDTVQAYAGIPGWHHYRTEHVQVAGNITINNYVDGVLFSTGTVAYAPLPTPDTITIEGQDPSSGKSVGIAWVAVYPYGGAPNGLEMASAVHGYNTETGLQRVERICRQEHINFIPGGSATDDYALGPQPEGTVLAVFADTAKAASGILYEPREANGIFYRPRREMYDVDALALDFTAYELSPPLEPLQDDRFICNDIRMKNATGTNELRYTQWYGDLNASEPGTREGAIGTFARDEQTNVADDTTALSIAAWLVRRGTTTASRWPTVTLELHRAEWATQPAKRAAVLALDIGARITLVNLPARYGALAPVLMIVGYEEEIRNFEHTITFNCVPIEWMQAWRYGAPTARYNPYDSTLNTAITTTETILSVAFTGKRWVRSADDAASLPFDVMVGGEQMTVTAVTGTTEPQEFTVTRAVNGVVKAHTLGTKITLVQQSRYAL